MIRRRLLSPAVLALVLCLGGSLRMLSGSSHSKEPSGPGPEERILVEPLGYRPPGQLYMLSHKVFSSLDFVDAHHLLFTFHQSRLLQTRAESRPDGGRSGYSGRGSPTSRTGRSWTPRNGGCMTAARYLWSLGDGKFLVRERNSYSVTDSSLKLHPYIDVASPVYATEVSPDGRILVVEHEYERHTSEEHTRLEAQAAKFGDPPPARRHPDYAVGCSFKASTGCAAYSLARHCAHHLHRIYRCGER